MALTLRQQIICHPDLVGHAWRLQCTTFNKWTRKHFATQKSSTKSKSTLKEGIFIAKHYDEISIPVPWGHVAAKWYGPKHVRPLVGMHGWQDNAGTFDPLASLLPSHLSFLSIDLPGHGHSSWLPDGMSYHSIDYVLLLRRLMDEFKWEKISLLAHSMSSQNGFVFCSLFPDKVDLFIGLDILKPLTLDTVRIVDNYAKRLEQHMLVEQRMRNGSEPPCYDWEQLEERLHNGSFKSVNLDSCKYLLQRNTKPSQHEPNKFYFSRDNRLKTSLFYAFATEVLLEMARRIRCPYLFIKAKQASYFEKKEYFYQALEVMRKNPHFEFHEVDGTHHVHLNEPNKIADIINPFINKWRP